MAYYCNSILCIICVSIGNILRYKSSGYITQLFITNQTSILLFEEQLSIFFPLRLCILRFCQHIYFILMSTVDVINIYVGQASGTSKEAIVPEGMWTLFYSFCVSVSLFTFIIAVKLTIRPDGFHISQFVRDVLVVLLSPVISGE